MVDEATGPKDRPTVLIVDDEPEMADLYAAWLTDQYEIRTAYDSTEALDRLDETVNVVLLDRRMPETSGDELLAELRAAGYDCPVAMVTAVQPEADVLEMSFDDYLVKPVFEEELFDLVERLLDRQAYDAVLREYYSLARKRSLLDHDSDGYRQLTAELNELSVQLDQTMEGFVEEDYGALFGDLTNQWEMADADD